MANERQHPGLPSRRAPGRGCEHVPAPGTHRRPTVPEGHVRTQDAAFDEVDGLGAHPGIAGLSYQFSARVTGTQEDALVLRAGARINSDYARTAG